MVNSHSLLCCPLLSLYTVGLTGGPNTASPTTPPYPYRVYLAMSTLKWPISLCSRYFMTCTTLFYFIVLQFSYIVKFFDTLPNVTLLFRFKDIIHAQSFKCLLLCTLNAARRRRKSPRAPLLFTFYRAPAVSDFHDLSNTPPFSLSPLLLTHYLPPILN